MNDLNELSIFLAKLLRPIINDAIKEQLNLSKDAIKNTESLTAPDFKYIPIQDIFKKKICSKPTFYDHLKKGHFTLYKFGNKSFVDGEEFLKAFRKVNFNNKTDKNN